MTDALYDIAKIFVTVILTSVFTYYLGSRKEKNTSKRDLRIKQLDEVFEPINRLINDCTSPYEGYHGLGIKGARKVVEILEINSAIIDEDMRFYYWAFREDIDQAPDYEYFGACSDKNGDFRKYVLTKSNKLRKLVDRPYVNTFYKCKKRIRDAILRRRNKKLHKVS